MKNKKSYFLIRIVVFIKKRLIFEFSLENNFNVEKKTQVFGFNINNKFILDILLEYSILSMNLS